jgi:hypothetical protein
MASLDNPKYAYRKEGESDSSWTLVEATDGSFPESFEGDGNTRYEVKTKIWSDSAFITTEQATLYVRPAGSTYGTGDGSSYANAWAGFSNIVWASVANNTLAVCGNHTEALNIQADNCTIIGNDANEAGVIDCEDTLVTGVNIANRTDVVITGLTVIDATTNGFFFSGTTTATTNDIVANGTGNQGIQHYNTVVVTHNNPTCNNNADDGISAHDSATVVINGGTFTGNDVAVNTIADSTTTINGPVTMSGNISQDIWPTNATTDESCLITINDCTLTGTAIANAGGKIVANNCTLPTVEIASGTGAGFFEATNSVISSYEDNNDAEGIFNNSLITWAGTTLSGSVNLSKSRVLNDAIVSSGASVTARHTLFSGGNDMQLDFQNGSTADIAYCVFYNMAANQFGTAFRTGVNITNYHNNTIVGVSNVGRGLFAQEPNTAQNLIFTNLDIAAFQNTGAQTLENCCFFNNDTDKNGTFTSNDEVATDPVLVDAANLDFSLGAGSSCIGTGESLTDDEGIDTADWGNGTTTTPTVTTKTQGASWDIGAYIS